MSEAESLAETSEDTGSDAEIKGSGGQLHLWDKKFDLPEHKKRVVFLKRRAKEKFNLELIDVYRSLPALWQIKSKNYCNRQLKNEQYEILLKKYKEQYPFALLEDVKQKINSLRTTYNRELKRISPSGISSLYYFQAMNFLSDIKMLPNQDGVSNGMQGKSKRNAKKFTRPPSLLNDEELIELAKIYKTHSCLWDANDIAYRFANRRREAMKILLDDINIINKVKLTLSDLEKEIALMRKICSIEKREKIACKRNNISFKPKCPYYDRIKYLEPDVTPYECSICGKVFFGVCQYKIHEASHDGSSPFKCQVCGHGFNLATNLTVHLRRHVQDYTYNCKICQKPCATTTELKTHMRFHTGERPFVCEICGKNYSSYVELRKHKDRHTGKKRFKCEICMKTFYEKTRVLEHMAVHTTQVRNHICNVCNKGFTNRKHLRQHQLIHNPEKKYECVICGKRFAQNSGLSGHMKSHGSKIDTGSVNSEQ